MADSKGLRIHLYVLCEQTALVHLRIESLSLLLSLPSEMTTGRVFAHVSALAISNCVVKIL
jgi:hypothetical protein